MDIRKIYFGIVTLLCLYSTHSFTSAPTSPKSVSHHAEVETLFLPQAREEIFKRLTTFIGTARNKILIAMYWLTTDAPVIELLLQAKRQNVDIQIILDKSSPKIKDLITKLSRDNIVPLISIRPAGIEGIMHNKFIVIDDTAVWTGSANFTRTVIRPDLQTYNDENILIINSPDVAKQYSDEFQRLKQSIIGFYMHHIEFRDMGPVPQRILPKWFQVPEQLPDWFSSLCIKLFETNTTFREEIFKILTDPQKMHLYEKIYTLFPTLKMTSADTQAPQEAAATQQSSILPLTPRKAILLRSLGCKHPTSQHEAAEFIDQLSRELDEAEESTEESYEEYSSEPTMSELQEQEEESHESEEEITAPAAQRRRLEVEKATLEQKRDLETLVFDSDVSREEAERILDETLKEFS